MTVDRVRDCARVDGVECVGGKVRVWDERAGGRREAKGAVPALLRKCPLAAIAWILQQSPITPFLQQPTVLRFVNSHGVQTHPKLWFITLDTLH